MRKRLIFLVLFFVTTTFFGSWAWLFAPQQDRDFDSGGEILLSLKEHEISKLVYESKNIHVKLMRKVDRLGAFWEVETERRVLKNAINGSPFDKKLTVVEESVDALSKVGHRRFLLGTTGKDFISRIIPFRVRSKIGGIKGREEDFGFTNSVAKFEIFAKEKTTFDVGGSGYGSSIRYIRDDEGMVFAVDGKMFRTIIHADQKFEAKVIFARESSEIQSILIRRNKGDLFFSQKNRDSEKPSWKVEGSKDSEVAEAWLKNKLLPLSIEGFVPKVLVPEGLEVVLEFEMKLDAFSQKVSGVFYRKGKGAEQGFYARTDLTRGYVKVNSTRFSDILEDLENAE